MVNILPSNKIVSITPIIKQSTSNHLKEIFERLILFSSKPYPKQKNPDTISLTYTSKPLQTGHFSQKSTIKQP